MLWPFISFYGGKWRTAPHYPNPQFNTIIEPFAGSAGYATRYADRNVILVEADPILASLWTYLIKVSENEIRQLPLSFDHVDNLNIASEAKTLIGFWLNKGAASPCKTPSKWMRDGIRPNSFWGEVIRERIASQLWAIRHWKVIHGSYTDLPNIEATWFIDPPYSTSGGRHYRFDKIDYDSLSYWCQSRLGQIIVCGQAGETWLPFKPFRRVKANEGGHGKRFSDEVIYESNRPQS